MTVIRSSVLIRRPIDEVFDFTVDSRNELQWNPEVREMTKLTDGPFSAPSEQMTDRPGTEPR